MTAQQDPNENRKKLLARVIKVFGWVILFLFGLVLFLLVAIQLSPVQNYIRKKAVGQLEKRLHTQVSLGKLSINFPTSISLQEIYLEDEAKDTLLYGKEVRVDINMFRLLRKEVNIREIYLNGIVANVLWKPADSSFNYQFIIDAFVGEETEKSEKESSSSMKVSINEVGIDHSHFIYRDLPSGNDLNVRLNHFKTTIETFDLDHLRFAVDLIEAKGVKGYFNQLEPEQKVAGEVRENVKEDTHQEIKLTNKVIRLSDINFQFNSEEVHLQSSYIIGRAKLNPKKIDLKSSQFALHNAFLVNSDVVIQIAPGQDEHSADTTIVSDSAASLKIISDQVTLENSSFNMDDRSKDRLSSGMDFNHLHLSEINLEAKNILYSLDTIRAAIETASLKDSSGFVLDKMQTDFEMNPTALYLKKLYLQTPNSKIKRSVSMTYPSLQALSETPEALGLDIDLEESTVSVKDLLFFAPQLEPQLAEYKNDSLSINAIINGSLANLRIQKLKLSGLSGTKVDMQGTLTHLLDQDKIGADLDIKTLATSKKDLLALLPPDRLPSDIQLPSQINIAGTIKGGLNHLRTNLGIKTDLGNAKLAGTAGNITDKKRASYQIKVGIKDLQLGKFISNPDLGTLSGETTVEGMGLDPQTADAQFDIHIPTVGFHQYVYNNITLNGELGAGHFKGDFQIKDSAISTKLSAEGSLTGKYPAVKVEGIVDSVDALALHFSSDSVKYHGRIFADFSNTNPDTLNGKLIITRSVLVTGQQRYKIDSVAVVATAGDTNRLSIHTGFASLNLAGQYKLTELGEVFTRALNPYFQIVDSVSSTEIDPYHFSLTGTVYDNTALRAVLPDLESMSTIQLNSIFDQDSGWNLQLTAPHIHYKEMVIDSVKLAAETEDSLLTWDFGLNRLINGSSMSIYKTAVEGTASNNNLTADLSIFDKEDQPKYFLSALLAENQEGDKIFSLSSDSLLLNYDRWEINKENQIQFGDNQFMAKDFVLKRDHQMLSASSDSSAASAPLQLDFTDFKLSTLSGFIQMDSLLVGGVLNGEAQIRDLQTQPVFTADLEIEDLRLFEDTLGTLNAKVDNQTEGQLTADIRLQGQGNDIALNGDYFLKSEDNSFDLTLDIHEFRMKSLEGLTKGAIRDARGFIYGQVKASGTMKDRDIDGHIQFDHTSITPSALNNVYKIDQEAIALVNNEGIRLNSFTIRDTADNALTLGGMIHTTDWMNYQFDMTVNADHFQAINSTQADNKSFYGKLIFSTKLNIKGTPTQPVVDGDLSIDDHTSFTLVLPTDDPGVVEREGVVQFVDFSATAEDSVFLNTFDSLKTAPFVGYDVSLNINISNKAEFNVIVDPANGDFLHIRGTGQLSGGIDPSGKVTLTGDYEVEDGSYSLSFNFLKRKFLIQKGSQIEWTGDPTLAQIDLTAIYETNTAPYELVEEMLSGNNIYYKQKLPFEVYLKMEDELLKPEVSFDIALSDKNSTVSADVTDMVEQRLTQLRQEPSDLNKQVFALLLLNRFIGENPFDNNSEGTDAATFAKQSASRLLSEQLNKLTEGLIEGVDLNFDLETTEDYTTGEKQDRTNLQVGVTKRLLDDRLTVTVGNNFELEGPEQGNQKHSGLSDNISINYSLSKDGRYMLRAYRTNDYTGALEGYVIETGLSFIITLDYDKLSEIFRSKEEREQKREIKRQNKTL